MDITPTLVPLGDAALLVRFGTTLSEPANRAAVGFARAIAGRLPAGVIEVVPSLVSVLVTYDPARLGSEQLAGEMRLLASVDAEAESAATHSVAVRFDGDDNAGFVAFPCAMDKKCGSEEGFAATGRAADEGWPSGRKAT